MIDEYCQWRRHFNNGSQPEWDSSDLYCGLPLRLLQLHAVLYFCSGDFWSCLLWNVCIFLVLLDQELSVVVIYNWWYILTHGKYHPYSLHILSSINYTFEYIFGACWLFVIDNLLLLFIHTLLMVVIVKPSKRKNCRFHRHHSAENVLMNKAIYLSDESKADS